MAGGSQQQQQHVGVSIRDFVQDSSVVTNSNTQNVGEEILSLSASQLLSMGRKGE